MRVTAHYRIDLRPHDGQDLDAERAIRHAAHESEHLTLVVAEGQTVAYAGVAYLREHGHNIQSVAIESDHPPTIERWVAALRNERSNPWT